MKKLIFFLLLLNIPTSWPNLEQRFYCTDGSSGYRLFLFKNKSLEAQNEDSSQKVKGTYQLENKKISLHIPFLHLKETSLQEEWGKGLLLTFQMSQFFCHSTAHDQGPSFSAYAKCPTIRYIPALSYENNSFEFHPNHMVKWRSWKEVLKIPDTFYSEYFGIYLIKGKKFFLFFGDKENDRYLTGTLLNQGQNILIDQLEPKKGPCQIH